MLQAVKPHDAMALGRLLEFLSPNLPWNRSLWSPGLVLNIRELSEGCAVLQKGTLSDGSVRRICSALQRKASKDQVLSDAEKAHLRQQIQSVPKAGGPAHHTLEQMAERLDLDYLQRWARVVATSAFKVELFARSVASHVLDAGFSAQYVHKFLKAKVGDSELQVTLSDLCEELHLEQARSPLREFDVLLAFSKPPKLSTGLPADWLQEEAVSAWLTSHGFDTTDIRAPAAIRLTVTARDTAGAAQIAREIADRFAARLRIATGEVLSTLPILWVVGDSGPTPLIGESRGVRVKELDREARVFTTPSADDAVEAALELMAHLDESSPPAAIAGGWGAIEGLLADSGDRATAADNLASLVACSFPRAELTALSFKIERQDKNFRERLQGLQTNRLRSIQVAKMISGKTLPSPKAWADRAAVERMGKLLANPGKELQTIRDEIGDAFHRLYRQRNLILHGGQLNSVALKASLRTVSKLAGAGMDRITHGHYVQQLRPLELVARANLSIALINKETANNCVDLLEPVEAISRPRK